MRYSRPELDLKLAIDNSKRSAIQNSIGDITPSLYCSISLVEVEGKQIGVIEVPHLTENTPDMQIFKNLKLLTDDNQFKNGAVLFFGKQPELIFEKAVLRCVAFKGIDKQYIIDDKFFGGPLYNQTNKAIQWLKEKTNLRYDIE